MATQEELKAIRDRVTRQHKTDRISVPPGIPQRQHDAVFALVAEEHPEMTAGAIEEQLTWAGYWAVPEPTTGSTAPVQRSPTISAAVLQGDTRGLTQRAGLHTPTMAEILADASRPDPTALYFDTSSDHMGQINPLASHWDLSGDFPTLVTPLTPGPKMPTNG